MLFLTAYCRRRSRTGAPPGGCWPAPKAGGDVLGTFESGKVIHRRLVLFIPFYNIFYNTF